jgi:hypothetical protein
LSAFIPEQHEPENETACNGRAPIRPWTITAWPGSSWSGEVVPQASSSMSESSKPFPQSPRIASKVSCALLWVERPCLSSA